MILAIETTGPVASVALLGDGIAAVHRNTGNYSHLEEIAPMVKDILAEQGIRGDALDAVAVSRGPGSFTGVRIGVATAKGLAQVWNKPIVAVPTLESFAWSKDLEPGDVICPLFDARRGQVYCGAWLKLKNRYSEILGEQVCDVKEFLAKLKPMLDSAQVANQMLPYPMRLPNVFRVIFCGDGAEAYADTVNAWLTEYNRGLEQFMTPEDPGASGPFGTVRPSFRIGWVQDAENIAKFGQSMFEDGKITDCYGVEPEYLREAEASKNLRTHNLGIFKDGAIHRV